MLLYSLISTLTLPALRHLNTEEVLLTAKRDVIRALLSQRAYGRLTLVQCLKDVYRNEEVLQFGVLCPDELLLLCFPKAFGDHVHFKKRKE